MEIENVLLTEEQIEQKTRVYIDGLYYPEMGYDTNDVIEGYTSGWKECTEHYRELIEAGARQKEPVDKVDAVYSIIKGIQILSELSDDEMEDIINTVIARRNKNKQIDQL